MLECLQLDKLFVQVVLYAFLAFDLQLGSHEYRSFLLARHICGALASEKRVLDGFIAEVVGQREAAVPIIGVHFAADSDCRVRILTRL